MDPIRQLLLIGLFGALGAVSRYGISLGVNRWLGDTFPAGTFVVNIVGCFLLGLLAGLAVARPETSHALAPGIREAVMIGFLGALTTFSTFSLDTIKCLEQQAYTTAMLNVVASLAVGLAAVYGGLLLARWIAAS
jgi:CrcB protein